MGRRLRSLAGPTGRRLLTFLLLAALWAWWFWAPPRPRETWTAANADFLGESSDDSTFIVGSIRQESVESDPTGVRPNVCPVRIIDSATGRVLGRLFDGEDATIHILTSSSDGRRVLAANCFGAAVVWDRTAARVTARLTGVNCRGELSPDGRRVVAATSDQCQNLALWPDVDRAPPVPLPRARYPAHFSPDGREVATADETGPGIRLWDPSTGCELPRTYKLSSLGRAWNLAYSGDIRRFAALTAAGVEVFDTTSKSPVVVLPLPHASAEKPARVEFDPYGRLLVVRWSNHHVAVWDLSTTPPEDVTTRMAYFPDPASVFGEAVVPDRTCPVFSPDGRQVLADANPRWRMRLFDADALAHRSEFALPPGTLDYTSAVFPPDGRLLAVTASNDGWRLPSDLQEWRIAAQSRSLILQRRWATYVFEVKTGRQLAVLPGHPEENLSRVDFIPDGRVRVASVTKNQERTLVVRTYDLPTVWPPAWLIAATVGGIALIVTDWRQSMRYR